MLTTLTVLSAAPATLKFAYDAVDFYSKVKALRSPSPPRPLAELENLSKFEKAELTRMYQDLEKCRRIASEIATRALRFYLVVTGLVTAASIVCAIVLIWAPHTEWWLAAIGAIVIVGPTIIRLIPAPVPRAISFLNSLPILNDESFASRIDKIGKSLHEARSAVLIGVATTFRAAGLSIPEGAFLVAYSRADALVRALECEQLTKALEKGVRTAYETFSGKIFDTAVKIIMQLARDQQLHSPEQRRRILLEKFDEVGLADLVSVELVGEDFFGLDFPQLAKSEPQLRERLKTYLPLSQRT